MKKLIQKFNLNPRLSLWIPYLIYAIFLIILPIIIIAVKAFTPISQDGSTYNNYNSVQQSAFWQIMARSIWLGLACAFISFIIGMPFAYIVARSNSTTFKTVAMSLIISPMLIFTLVRVLAIQGFFSSFLAPSSLNNSGFLLFGLTYIYLPFMIIPMYLVFKNMPKNILDASYDLGYSQIKTFIKIVMPYSIKSILSGIGVVFLMSSTSIGISAKLLPNSSQHLLIGNVINGLANPSNVFNIASVSNIVLVTICIMSLIYIFIYFIPLLIMKKKGMKNV